MDEGAAVVCRAKATGRVPTRIELESLFGLAWLHDEGELAMVFDNHGIAWLCCVRDRQWHYVDRTPNFQPAV